MRRSSGADIIKSKALLQDFSMVFYIIIFPPSITAFYNEK